MSTGDELMAASTLTTATCPRCKHLVDAEVSTPWERPNGVWVEWVKVLPHLHGNTLRSTCKPKGYARRTHREVAR